MNQQITASDTQSHIVHLPNRPPVMLAQDLATIYGVEPRQLSQAVRRNPDRFPEPEFCFRLTDDDLALARSQNVTLLSRSGGWAPWAFTHMGANQISTVLRTPTAARRSVEIMRAFSALEAHSGTHFADHSEIEQLTAERDAARSELADLRSEMTLKDELIGLYRERPAPTPKPKRAAPTPVTEAEAERIRALHAQGLSQNEIARRSGRSSSAVSWIVRGAKAGAQ